MKPRIKQLASQLQQSLAGASAVLLMLFAGQAGLTQQSASRPPASTASALPAATGESRDGAIKVHGHWVIDLKNPDGTLAGHREFENSLAVGQGGDAFLIGLLAGYFVPGDYGILLQGPAQPPLLSSASSLSRSRPCREALFARLGTHLLAVHRLLIILSSLQAAAALPSSFLDPSPRPTRERLRPWPRFTTPATLPTVIRVQNSPSSLPGRRLFPQPIASVSTIPRS
jgi:hypothetical protein